MPLNVEEQRIIDNVTERLDALEIHLGLKRPPPSPEEAIALEKAAKDAAERAEWERLQMKFANNAAVDSSASSKSSSKQSALVG